MHVERVVVTGASGLLGTAVALRLRRDAQVVALGHRQAFPGVQPIDLMDDAALAALAREPPTAAPISANRSARRPST